MKNRRNLKGFTLIEILIVIGLIAILAAITIIALNPTENFQAARNSERQSEVSQIANSIDRWVIDGGSLTDLTLSVCGTISDSSGKEVVDITPLTDIFPGGEDIVPKDPIDEDEYRICGTSSSYTIFAPNTDGDRIVLTR